MKPEDLPLTLRVGDDGALYIGDVQVGGKLHSNSPGRYWLLPLDELQTITKLQQQGKL